MLAIVGTVPVEGFPLVAGYARITEDSLEVDGHTVPINRGTPALIAAAVKTAQALALHDPFCYLIGDIGRGTESRKLYEYLSHFVLDLFKGYPLLSRITRFILPKTKLFPSILSPNIAQAQTTQTAGFLPMTFFPLKRCDSAIFP